MNCLRNRRQRRDYKVRVQEGALQSVVLDSCYEQKEA